MSAHSCRHLFRVSHQKIYHRHSKMQKSTTMRGPLSAKDIELARMPCYVRCEYLNTGTPHLAYLTTIPLPSALDSHTNPRWLNQIYPSPLSVIYASRIWRPPPCSACYHAAIFSINHASIAGFFRAMRAVLCVGRLFTIYACQSSHGLT
jgi:hypothetical protein